MHLFQLKEKRWVPVLLKARDLQMGLPDPEAPDDSTYLCHPSSQIPP